MTRIDGGAANPRCGRFHFFYHCLNVIVILALKEGSLDKYKKRLQHTAMESSSSSSITDNPTADYIISRVGPETVIRRTVSIDMDMVSHIRSMYDKFPADEVALMRAYFKRHKNGNQIVEETVFCKRAKAVGEVYGRLYPRGGLGLAALPSDVRNAIAAKYYKDIDFKNAHASLLLQRAKKENNPIDCPCRELEFAVTHREEIFADLATQFGFDKGTAKTFFVSTLFNGNPRLLPEGEVRDFFTRLRAEVTTIALYFATKKNYASSELGAFYNKHWKLCNKYNSENPVGGFTNLLFVEQ